MPRVLEALRFWSYQLFTGGREGTYQPVQVQWLWPVPVGVPDKRYYLTRQERYSCTGKGVVMMIQINIDEKKCVRPPECTKCLQLCPEGVLLNYPRDRRAPGKAAGDWVVVPAQTTLCTGCKICEQVCPEKAITVNCVT